MGTQEGGLLSTAAIAGTQLLGTALQQVGLQQRLVAEGILHKAEAAASAPHVVGHRGMLKQGGVGMQGSWWKLHVPAAEGSRHLSEPWASLQPHNQISPHVAPPANNDPPWCMMSRERTGSGWHILQDLEDSERRVSHPVGFMSPVRVAKE